MYAAEEKREAVCQEERGEVWISCIQFSKEEVSRGKKDKKWS